MNDLLAELKAAARRQPAQSEREIIAAGPTTWFSGPAAPAPEGTIALAKGDAKIIIDEKDVRAVEKDEGAAHHDRHRSDHGVQAHLRLGGHLGNPRLRVRRRGLLCRGKGPKVK